MDGKVDRMEMENFSLYSPRNLCSIPSLLLSSSKTLSSLFDLSKLQVFFPMKGGKNETSNVFSIWLIESLQ